MNDQLFESSIVSMNTIFTRIGTRLQAAEALRKAEDLDPIGEQFIKAFQLLRSYMINIHGYDPVSDRELSGAAASHHLQRWSK